MPKPKSCSICCIVMLTHRNFDEIIELCFEKELKDFSMDLNTMENILQKAGLQTTRLDSIPQKPQKDMLVECRNKMQQYWHYIVYDAEQKVFLDPIPNPPDLAEYDFYRVIEVE